jgi:type I restriction enzyme M protein
MKSEAETRKELIDKKLKASDRKEKYFFVPKAEIVAENYDLSMSKYKEDVFEEVEYEKPAILMAKLKSMESEISKELNELEKMLGEEVNHG